MLEEAHKRAGVNHQKSIDMWKSSAWNSLRELADFQVTGDLAVLVCLKHLWLSPLANWFCLEAAPHHPSGTARSNTIAIFSSRGSVGIHYFESNLTVKSQHM